MTQKKVEALMDDIRLVSDQQYATVQAVRKLVKTLVPASSEAVKYGGILFSVDRHFCGVFAYKKHVSVEFSHGAAIDDINGHLEGKGKGRRHLKLLSMDDIESKALADYIPKALQVMQVEP
ncbi:MAG: DUF1801 domain-containing protein [Woeseiaceae bacterium]